MKNKTEVSSKSYGSVLGLADLSYGGRQVSVCMMAGLCWPQGMSGMMGASPNEVAWPLAG